MSDKNTKIINKEIKVVNSSSVRTRIAPSPTGPMHIGIVRTALFNYLFTKKNNGKFILRIEDTDIERSKIEWEKNIIENLKWLGIQWDEGPDIDGKYAPYRQSQRTQIYTKYLKKLLEEGKAYYCFCSKEDIEAKRQYQMSIGEPTFNDDECRNLSSETVKKYLDEKKPSVIRFKVIPKKIKFIDLIRGEVEFDSGLFKDFVIAKNLLNPLYNFTVAVDDFEMKISHIIRGEDHISNTPRQILIQEALGFPMPEYAHLPLILGPDRSKLSKRHGAVSVSEYIKDGYLKEALINFIAFLGWNPGDEKEVLSMDSLIKEFSLKRVQKGGAIFDTKKLDWLNSCYIRQMSLEKLTELCLPYFIKNHFLIPIFDSEPIFGGSAGRTPMEARKFKILETEQIISLKSVEKIVFLYQERLKKISEITEFTDFFFKKELDYNKELLVWKEMSNKEIKKALDKLEKLLSKIKKDDFNKEELEKILIPELERAGDKGQLLWPLRVALTGKKASAGPLDIAEILGREKTLKRIKKAKEILKSNN